MKNDFVFEWLELSQPPAVTHGTQTRTPRRLEQLSLFWGGCFSCAPCRLHRVVIHSRQTHTHTHADTKDISKSTFFLFWIPTIFRNNNGRDFFFLPPSTILDDNDWRKAVNWLGLVWSDIQSAETFCYSYVDIIIIQGMKWFLCVCDWQVHQKTGRIRPHRVGNGIQKPLALFVFRNQVLSCCQVSVFFLYAHTHRK